MQNSEDNLFALARMVLRSGRYPAQHRRTTRLYDQINPGRYIETVDEEATMASIHLTMARAVESRIPPIVGLYSIVWYNDRPCLYGDVALAMVEGHKDFHDICMVMDGEPMTDGWKAQCTISRRNPDGTPNHRTAEFSWKDAKRAGLTRLDHYQKYPERMLTVRARSWAMRDLFADVLNGLAIAEEQQDVELLAKIPEDKGAAIQRNVEASMDEFTKAALEAKGKTAMPNMVDALRPPSGENSPDKAGTPATIEDSSAVASSENSLVEPSGKLTVEGLDKAKGLLSGEISEDPPIKDVDVEATLRAAEEKHKKRKDIQSDLLDEKAAKA